MSLNCIQEGSRRGTSSVMPQHAFRQISSAVARGALGEAYALCLSVLQSSPDDPNAQYLSGVVASKRREHSVALRHLTQACIIAPGAAQAQYWRGIAARHLGEHEVAREAFETSLALAPNNGDAMYNLGLTLLELGRQPDAGALFLRAASIKASDHAALQAAVDCAGALAMTEVDPPQNESGQRSPVTRNAKFSVIVCSIDPEKLTRFSASLHSTFATTAIELIHIDDAKSLCEGYARGAARARGDYLVFCHDDIVFLDAAFHDRLLDALESTDVVGVCGTTRLRGATIAQSASGTAHGWVAHDAPGDKFLAGILSTAPARVDRIQALDGVFIAARRAVVEQIGFDAETFDGFHLYDLDFTYRAFKAGFRLRVQSDLLIAHASFGNFSGEHAVYAERFLAKHPELLKLSTEVSDDRTLFFQMALPDVRKVRTFYAWIDHFSRPIQFGK